MMFQNVTDGVKGRVETLRAQGRNAVAISSDTLGDVKAIASDSLHAFAKDWRTAVDELYSSAKAGVSQARTDGVKAVVSKPIDYFPATSDFTTAMRETFAQLKAMVEEILNSTKSGVIDLRTTLVNKPKAKPGRKSVVKKAKSNVVPIKRTLKKAA